MLWAIEMGRASRAFAWSLHNKARVAVGGRQLQPPGRDAEATVAQPNTFRSHVIAQPTRSLDTTS